MSLRSCTSCPVRSRSALCFRTCPGASFPVLNLCGPRLLCGCIRCRRSAHGSTCRLLLHSDGIFQLLLNKVLFPSNTPLPGRFCYRFLLSTKGVRKSEFTSKSWTIFGCLIFLRILISLSILYRRALSDPSPLSIIFIAT